MKKVLTALLVRVDKMLWKGEGLWQPLDAFLGLLAAYKAGAFGIYFRTLVAK